MTRFRRVAYSVAAVLLAVFPPAGADSPRREIPAGWYRDPFRPALVRDSSRVGAFRLDERAVTVGEYLAFVKRHPEWAKSKAKRLFADSQYLASWRADNGPSPAVLSLPVTEVSWYAAKAYCAARGARLPTTAEWERIAGEIPPGLDSAAYRQRILDWYARPASAGIPPGPGSEDAFGIQGLHGRIWEWTSDFTNASLGKSASGTASSGTAFCGGAGQATALGADYAVFMRYSFRTSLKPDFALSSLGFRCAEGDTP